MVKISFVDGVKPDIQIRMTYEQATTLRNVLAGLSGPEDETAYSVYDKLYDFFAET